MATLNNAKKLAPKGDPIMHGFFDKIDGINRLGDTSDGFLWRYNEDGNPLDSTLFGGANYIVNFSVWESINHLKNFTYESAHGAVYRRKKEWFEKLTVPSMVLWYIEEGHIPTQKEASEKLLAIQRFAPKPEHFDFKNLFSYAN